MNNLDRKEPVLDFPRSQEKTLRTLIDYLKEAEKFVAIGADVTTQTDVGDFRGWVCFRTPLEAERFYNHMKPLSTQRIYLGVDLVIFNA